MREFAEAQHLSRPEKPMILAADNLRITRPAIAQAVQRLDPEPIRQLVMACEAAGAEAIDINCGPLYRDTQEKMDFLVQTVQSATRLPLILDTANPQAMAAGLKAGRNPMIINGFSLQPVKCETILPLARIHGCRIIGYLLRKDGHVPADGIERLDLALALYDAFSQAGLENEQLIIDPVIVPLTWQGGNLQDRQVLTVLNRLPDLLGFAVDTIAGLSNLTAGATDAAQRRMMEQTYLAMLGGAGLSMALCDCLRPELVRTAHAVKALMQVDVFAWQALA
jgi:5-methyltetrahydrofolate corrinoid/iron sulfur protein methyltransferase